MYLQQVTEWVFVLLNVRAGAVRCQPVHAVLNRHLWVHYVCMPMSASVNVLTGCQTNLFGDGIEGRRCFVIQEDRWILQYGTGDGDALLLSS